MPPTLSEEGDWYQYRRLVLSELERIDESIKGLRVDVNKSNNEKENEISKLKVSIATLQVKASVFGAVGGILITVIAEFITKTIH